jgi:hypothetical protein
MGPTTGRIDISDSGIEPAIVFIPAGRPIQLMLRNRGATEHHYRVVGLVPDHLVWVSRPETAQQAAPRTPNTIITPARWFANARRLQGACVPRAGRCTRMRPVEAAWTSCSSARRRPGHLSCSAISIPARPARWSCSTAKARCQPDRRLHGSGSR